MLLIVQYLGSLVAGLCFAALCLAKGNYWGRHAGCAPAYSLWHCLAAFRVRHCCLCGACPADACLLGLPLLGIATDACGAFALWGGRLLHLDRAQTVRCFGVARLQYWRLAAWFVLLALVSAPLPCGII